MGGTDLLQMQLTGSFNLLRDRLSLSTKLSY
jgi:hypothetical protein